MEIIKADKVSYVYRTKYQTVQALNEVTCSFETGKMYAIVGESGSGKSTFLSLLAGLDVPATGTIYVEGQDLAERDRDHYRRDMASVVYQAFHLFPLLTAEENVMYPMELKGVSRREAAGKAKELLLEVGLEEKIRKQFPQMMSGGEQQRVAIARALAAGGKILLADEPTGNLDSVNEEKIVRILKTLAEERDYAVIVITHNQNVAKEADVVYQMKDGRLSDGQNKASNVGE